MSTLLFDTTQIIELCEVDAQIINKALSVSENLGRIAIKDAIGNFTTLIKSNKGNFVPAMDLDYRAYIINLLSISIEQATEDNKSIIISEIVLPSEERE